MLKQETEVKRNQRDPLPTHAEGKYIVQKFESKDVAPGWKDWRGEPVAVRVLRSVDEKKDRNGDIVSRRHIKWNIGNHKSKTVRVGEVITLTDRRTIQGIVEAGLGEIVTPENTKKFEKMQKNEIENKRA